MLDKLKERRTALLIEVGSTREQETALQERRKLLLGAVAVLNDLIREAETPATEPAKESENNG